MKRISKPKFWDAISPKLKYEFENIRQEPSETSDEYRERYSKLMTKIQQENDQEIARLAKEAREQQELLLKHQKQATIIGAVAICLGFASVVLSVIRIFF